MTVEPFQLVEHFQLCLSRYQEGPHPGDLREHRLRRRSFLIPPGSDETGDRQPITDAVALCVIPRAMRVFRHLATWT